MTTAAQTETYWNASPADEAPDEWWVDDDTGEYVRAATGERMSAEQGRATIKREAWERVARECGWRPEGVGLRNDELDRDWPILDWEAAARDVGVTEEELFDFAA